MSRSIHANRSLRQRRLTGETDWSAVHDKRDLKAGVDRERRSPAAPLPTTDVEHLVIRVIDEAQALFFPVTVDDIRAMLGELPRGVTTGLAEIRLESGHRWTARHSWRGSFDIVDRFGRACEEKIQGVLEPLILGTYFLSSQHISIYGFDRVSRKPLKPRQQIGLEMRMLSTVVHELVHHHDNTHRMGRGRARRSFDRQAESYARRMQSAWTIEFVIPFLQRKHGLAQTAWLRRLMLEPVDKRPRHGITQAERERKRHATLAELPPTTRRWCRRRMHQEPQARRVYAAAFDKVGRESDPKKRRQPRPRR